MVLEIDILPDGIIKFCRCNSSETKHLLTIINKLAPEKDNEVKEFLDGAKYIENIFGDKTLCG